MYTRTQGDIKMPTRDEMKREIRADERLRLRQYVANTSKYALMRKAFPYMESLATPIGCRPAIGWRAMLADPRLVLQLWFGVWTPCHYRLRGPNSWQGARKSVLQTWRRVETPFG